MKRLAIASLFGVLAIVGWWILRDTPSVEVPVEVVERPPPAPSPVRGQPCQIDVEVRGGEVRSARLFSSRAQLDVAAVVAADGRSFSGELPEQGSIFVAAVSTDGRNAARWVNCGGDGVATAVLDLPARDKSAANVDGRCIYLDTGVPVAGGVVRGRYEAGPKTNVVAAIADDDGRFQLQVPAGVYVFRCAKDADLGPPMRVSLDPESTQAVDLYVEARAGVSVVVLGADGAPVPNVNVTGRTARAALDAEPIADQTDDEGRVLLMGFQPGPVTVEAQHEGGFAEGHAVARIELPYAEVQLTLLASAVTVQGTVTDGLAVPVDGATIEVTEIGQPGVASQAPVRRTATSDPDGRFVVGGLLSGKHLVQATAPGMSAARVELNLIVGPTHVSLRLLPACTAKVKILPEEPKLPVRVSIRRDDGATWDVAGRTGEMLDVPEASGSAKIFAKSTGARVKSATASASLCDGPIVIELRGDDSDGSLIVRVRDRDGALVDGAEVWVDAPGGRARTGKSGEVRFDGLESRTYRVATIDAIDPKSVEVTAGLTAEVELTTDRKHGDIRGVVLAGGAPVEGASILASCGDSGRAGAISDASVVARSDAAGKFVFTPRDGGLCEVRAEHASRGRSRAVTLQAGSDPATIMLDVGATIAGRVVSVEGARAIAPYTLVIQTAGSAAQVETRTQYVSSPDGAFVIEDVAPGRVSLRVNAEGGRGFEEVDVAAGERREGVVIKVFTRGEIVGRIAARDGTPVAGARIEARAVGRPVARTASGADGRFTTTVPAGEPVRVNVSAQGFYPKGTPPVALTGGQPTDIGEITLEPRGGPEEKQAGIGIMISAEARGIRIIRFVDQSPAREAGLQIGDIIVAIEGVPAGREPLMNWVVSLRGPVGTPVTLEAERGTNPPFVVTIIRREVGLGELPQRAP